MFRAHMLQTLADTYSVIAYSDSSNNITITHQCANLDESFDNMQQRYLGGSTQVEQVIM